MDTIDSGSNKKAEKVTSSLSIDRAAFLILRVKKAFKKKRQLRKEKQAAAAAIAAQTGTGRSTRKGIGPPPLLRSRTLPAIIVPGFLLQSKSDKTYLTPGDGISHLGSFAARLSLQPRTSNKLLTSDDSSLEYRRRSSGSPNAISILNENINFNNSSNNSSNISNNLSGTEPYIYAYDEVERHPDGSVVLRIPAPHIVAARAYRMSSTSGPSGSSPQNVNQQISNTNSSQSQTPLYRLAKLLNQSNKITSPIKDDAPRRLSWERRENANGNIVRSSSIDSMVEAVWSETSTPRPSLTVTSPQSNQLLQINYGNNSGNISRRESLLSPSPARRTKLHRGLVELTLPDIVTKLSQTNTTSTAVTTPQKYVVDKTYDPKLSQSTNSINMEFLIPHPPMTRSGQPSRHGGGGLGGIANILRSNGSSSSSNNITTPIYTNNSDIQNNKNYINTNSFKNNISNNNNQNDIKSINRNSYNDINNNSNTNNLNSNNNIISQNHIIQNKMTKKQLKLAQAQLDKLTQINIHLHALFSAVENGHLEKARTILESTDVDVNSLNTDGLSPLDVAVLSNNRSMTKMLLEHGAIEGSKYKTPDSLGNHLNSLLHDAENRIHELGVAEETPQIPSSTRASFSSIIGTAYPGSSVTGCTGTEVDKQMGLWERRVKGLRRMLLGWDQARPPDPPHIITVDVTNLNCVTVRMQESTDGPITTNFKVQWSSRIDFSNIVGECEVNEWNSFQGTMGATCRIPELTQGRRYFFRACSGNVKGYGPFRKSNPNSVVPSSWRDIDQKDHRFAGRQRILDDIFTAVRLARPDDATEIQLDVPPLQRRNPKKKTTIKQLFSAASKFQKNLKRGIYLACILYHEDKVLVTNEDFIPVIEIDETYPSCLNTDYHWLMKVACTWDDVKLLRTDMERNSTSAVHFRTKLLSAACQMQSALCIQDLGQLFYKPLRDAQGTVVLSCINNVKTPKSVSVLNSRWMPLNKVQKKLTTLLEDNNINEILLNSIQEQINYHQASMNRLGKGLYLSYLKMHSSVDQIQVVVPSKTPNVLPHCKIRDNPHVSAEEWEFLKKNKITCTYELRNTDKPTEVQELFLETLTHAAHRLFRYMDIPLDNALNHRLYDIEVIDLNTDVSLLIICPPAESSCAVPGQRELLLQRNDLISLPIQAFEMIHLRTYHNAIIQKYSRLSCILELDTIMANHSYREAFSSVEVQAAKERLAKLHDLSKNLNTVWKGVRWLMDVISFTRDRCNFLGLNMREIFGFVQSEDDLDSSNEGNLHHNHHLPHHHHHNHHHHHHNVRHSHHDSARQLLEPPARDTKLIKSSPGRGSWPGPSHSLGPNGLLGTEYSKSEQQLSTTSTHLSSTHYLCASSNIEKSRKNSADSNYSQSGTSYYSAGESSTVDLRSEHQPPSKQQTMEPQQQQHHQYVSRLPPSKSEDTLALTAKYGATNDNVADDVQIHRKRAITIHSSVSTASSPLLNIRASYPSCNTESVQSLSSDSDGGGCTGGVDDCSTGGGDGDDGDCATIADSGSDGSYGYRLKLSASPDKLKDSVSLKRHQQEFQHHHHHQNHHHHHHRHHHQQQQQPQHHHHHHHHHQQQQLLPLQQQSQQPKPSLNQRQNSQSLSNIRSENFNDTENISSNKRQMFESDPQVSSTLKSTLAALQNESNNVYKEKLHIAENETKITTTVSPKTTKYLSTENKRNANLVADVPSGSSTSKNDDGNDAPTTSTSSTNTNTNNNNNNNNNNGENLQSGIIQVYAAYETGLATGTSLKLHVTPKTSAREVIDLVVKQLNMAVVLKGKDGPIYTADKLENFCLVAVIGARERCLRDDFKPLQLQNPWKTGRLYVRQKHDLLAAIEHSNRNAQLI